MYRQALGTPQRPANAGGEREGSCGKQETGRGSCWIGRRSSLCAAEICGKGGCAAQLSALAGEQESRMKDIKTVLS
jgi:hypothetical protein